MVHCHSCHNYGTWRSKEVVVVGGVKFILWRREGQPTKGGGLFCMGVGVGVGWLEEVINRTFKLLFATR